MTVAELRTLIQARGYSADTAAQQLLFLNTTIRTLVARAPAALGAGYWTLATASVPIIAGTATYATPADFVNFESLRLVQPANSGGVYGDLTPVTADELLRLQSLGVAAARPTVWARTSATQYSVWPTPDRAYTATLTYRRNPAALVADGDVPIVPEAYQDILVAGSCELMAQRNRQWDAAAAFAAERETRTRQMYTALAIGQHQGPTVVARSGFYGGCNDASYSVHWY